MNKVFKFTVTKQNLLHSSFNFLVCDTMQWCSRMEKDKQRWRQHVPPKCWYPTTLLHSVQPKRMQLESSSLWKAQVSQQKLLGM